MPKNLLPAAVPMAFSRVRAGEIDVRRPSVPYALVREDGARSATIYIYGEIGCWGVTAASVAADLALVRDIDLLTVRISSYGGEAFEGVAIFNLLRSQPYRVEVVVDGIAASAASVIAMAGERITMAESAMMMIHDPWTVAWGNADALRKSAATLDKLKASLMAAYRYRAPEIDEARLSALLSEETWLSPAEAIALGLADEEVADDEAPVQPAPTASAEGLFRAHAETGERVVASLRAAVAARGKPTAAPAASADTPAPEAAQDPAREVPVAADATPAQGEVEAAAVEGAEPVAEPAAEAQETAPVVEAPAAPEAPVEAPQAAAAAPRAVVDPVAMAAVVREAGETEDMAIALLREGVSVEAAQARLATRREARAALEGARAAFARLGSISAADEAAILAATSAADARARIFDLLVGQEPEIDRRPTPAKDDAPQAAAPIDFDAAYRRRYGQTPA